MPWIRENDPDVVLDTVIAAVALEHGLTVATRNTLDFPDVPTVNPWNNPA
jgi:toxin FitB